MSGQGTGTAPIAVNAVVQALDKLIDTTSASTVATLAAAIISARGKPISIQEALDITRDIQFAIRPAPNHRVYQDWAKTKEERLSKVHD